jgi:phospholipid/cholesterol/gamma-HCH transport system substrate-binding protein
MKFFSERNPYVVGVVGCALFAAVTVGALQYKNLPIINAKKSYSAYFDEAGGLLTDAPVEVSGLVVGKVDRIDLDGARVLVKFSVDDDIRLGDRTEAAIKTRSILGAKVLDVTPRGGGTQSGTIPKDRTTSPYQLPDALGDLSTTISGLNTDQLSTSLQVLSDTFKDTPPALHTAVHGVTRFSQALDKRDAQLRNLLANASKTTAILAQRSDTIVGLVHDSNALLAELESQSSALDEISASISAFSTQLKGFIAENRDTLRPMLDKLNGVLTIVDNHKEAVQKAIKLLNGYALALGEAVSGGPFFKAYLANLLPGQFLQPFIDAAFSDLGLDPHTLLPSQRTDPQVGQPATPALPIPYPRTGQGGEPNLNLPDAITGKPGDQGCGPPGVPLPGPTGCYPYREPLPAPPPGGPPPGPPAVSDTSAPTAPTPSAVFLPAPGEPVPPGVSTPVSQDPPLPGTAGR